MQEFEDGFEMPISSLIVVVEESRVDDVVGVINSLPGAKVTKTEGTNILTLTETDSPEADKGLWDSLENIPGVVGVNLVYHNFEDVTEE